MSHLPIRGAEVSCHAVALHQAKTTCYGLYQNRDRTKAQFLEKFQTCISVVEQYGGIGAIKAQIEALGLAVTTPAISAHKAKAATTAMTNT
jgi:hypothetical protein